MAEENKKTEEKKTNLKAENDALRKQLADLQTRLEVAELELDAVKAAESLKDSVESEVNTGFVSAPEVISACEGYVLVEGNLHRVESRFTAKELLDQVRKRFVEEDRTVLVIDRHGD
jgi:hypothetical protein